MSPVRAPEIFSKNTPAVLVVVTIDAKILPVRAVRGVVHPIPVLVVHGQEIPVPEFKFPPALSADKAVNPEGLFPVIGRDAFPQFSDNLGNALVLRRLPPFRFSDLSRSLPQKNHPFLTLLSKPGPAPSAKSPCDVGAQISPAGGTSPVKGAEADKAGNNSNLRSNDGILRYSPKKVSSFPIIVKLMHICR